jgi:hypothetical protein
MKNLSIPISLDLKITDSGAEISKVTANRAEISHLTMSSADLKELMIEAARLGAQQVIDSLVSFNLKDAAKQIGITPKTLTKRIYEGKIRSVDGRVSGSEVQRYLSGIKK